MLEDLYTQIAEFLTTDLSLSSPVTSWLVAGLLLSVFELVVPGVYLIWFGLAAFAVSLMVWLAPMNFNSQLLWFAVYSAVFAFAGFMGYRYIFKRTQAPKAYAHLNNLAEQYVGLKVTVAEDCIDNQTKVKIGDTYWLAYSEKPLKKGATAKVVGVKDSLILVLE